MTSPVTGLTTKNVALTPSHSWDDTCTFPFGSGWYFLTLLCFVFNTMLLWWLKRDAASLVLIVILWLLILYVRMLIIKCHLEVHTLTQTHFCGYLNDSFVCGEWKPRCIFNIRNMYCYETTWLVKRTADYKTSSIINVFTYFLDSLLTASKLFLEHIWLHNQVRGEREKMRKVRTDVIHWTRAWNMETTREASRTFAIGKVFSKYCHCL